MMTMSWPLMSGFRLTPLLLQVILIHMMSQEPGSSSPTHGKPHLELLEVINWPPLVWIIVIILTIEIIFGMLMFPFQTVWLYINWLVGLPSYSTRKIRISVKANAYLDQWRPIYPIELREYAQYGASFQNTGYFSGVPVFDQNGARSQAYLPAAFEPYRKTNRNSILFQFLRYWQKIQLSILWMFCNRKVCWERHIKVLLKANYYVGQAQYIPVYTTSEIKGISISWW
jgi:hypothetical protein